MAFRLLIAATCIAILAVIGYYFVGEYRTAQARSAKFSAQAELQSLAVSCASHVEVLERAAANPGTVSEVEKAAAVEGRIACLEHGVP